MGNISINLPSFKDIIFFQTVVGDATTTYYHANILLGQSDHTYYISWLLCNSYWRITKYSVIILSFSFASPKREQWHRKTVIKLV